MREDIDFSTAERLEPRSDSWEKVVARIEAKKEEKRFILFRKLSSVAVAASVLLVAGAFSIGMNSTEISTKVLNETSYSEESISWYSSLGSGESVSTFTTAFDNYYTTGE
ncbi:MAG: hypothetical protein VZR14_04635 [Hallerella sp.]|jgi:hypothetical protein|nr:hypothetical protein [Hallerella sp.]